jgi:hypothetical protein
MQRTKEMDKMAKLAKVALLMENRMVERLHRLGLNAFGLYAREVLSHAGMNAIVLDDVDALEGSGADAVIAAVCADDERAVNRLTAYMEKGGIVFNCAGLNRLGGKLGYAKKGDTGAGYAFLQQAQGDSHPLRFLNASPWKALDSAQVPSGQYGQIRLHSPQGEEAGALLQMFQIGQGRLYRWSVDIWDTIVRMQQGAAPVLEDGVPAPDGTGNVNDNILKADDQIALDWKHDRLVTETGMPYFAYPYADLWREAFLGELLKALAERGLTLPFVGYYPAGTENIIMISHDSDINKDEHAYTTLALLDELGLRTTWCMLEPGYSKPIYVQVKKAGHELAFHYNGLESQKGIWSSEEFERQLQWLKDAADLEEVKSNKNHYTRFEGWGELFEWCERNGIEADQTRGPSKKGNVGMLFGTCHPYFPIAWATEGNRMYDVLEIGFLTQDLELPNLSDNSVIRPFLQQVKRVDGVAHFLYHQNHIHNREAVRDSIRRLVREARELGFEFWLSREVNDWERYRRTLQVELNSAGEPQVYGEPSDKEIVVYIPVAADSTGSAGANGTEIRFGVPCRKATAKVQRR